MGIYYIGFCLDEIQRTWMLHDVKETLASQILDTNGDPPAFLMTEELKVRDMPQDIKPSLPLKPQMNICIVDDDNKLQLPHVHAEKWSGHRTQYYLI